jgi:hypothetical protein
MYICIYACGCIRGCPLCLYVWVGVYVCVYVPICMCVCVCIRLYVSVYVSVFLFVSASVYVDVCVCVWLCGCICLHISSCVYVYIYISVYMCVRQCPYSPLCMHRTYILSRRQAYQHIQDMRFSSSGFGGRMRRPTTTVSCVGDSKTSRPARPPPIAGPLAAVGGVVTARGRLPVTVPRPGDGPGPLARGCYES